MCSWVLAAIQQASHPPLAHAHTMLKCSMRSRAPCSVRCGWGCGMNACSICRVVQFLARHEALRGSVCIKLCCSRCLASAVCLICMRGMCCQSQSLHRQGACRLRLNLLPRPPSNWAVYLMGAAVCVMCCTSPAVHSPTPLSSAVTCLV